MTDSQTRCCPRCGTALTIQQVAGRARPVCPACGEIVFHNPVPVGMAVVEHDRRLLLVRRGNPPLEGYWAPPAGHVEIDESVEEATLRETHEETGLEIALDGLAGVFSQAGIRVVIIAYHGRVVGGAARAGEDAVEVGFFGPEDLPVQPPPQAGAPVDFWFYAVLNALFDDWLAAQGKVRERSAASHAHGES